MAADLRATISPAPRHVRYERRSRGVGRPEAVASDDEQVQVPAYRRQCLGADAAQVTSGSLIGDGTDLLGHGERDLPQPGVLIRGNPYVMVRCMRSSTGDRTRARQTAEIVAYTLVTPEVVIAEPSASGRFGVEGSDRNYARVMR